MQTSAKPLARFVGIMPLLLLLFGGLLPAAGADHPSSFTILHVSDTHVCKLEGYTKQLAKKLEHFGRGYEPLRQLLSTVPGQVAANAVVITGDMIDFYEGEAGDGSLSAGQIEHFASLLPLMNVPLWLTLGNHDIQTHASSPGQVARIGGRATVESTAIASDIRLATFVNQLEPAEGLRYHRAAPAASQYELPLGCQPRHEQGETP
ncbi:MAG: metallophosphoesterase [Pirellulaceae bacterium]|nr:metallophosphoesterase [Thermoguttaceae bacterium]NLY99187.1 metallophosphoesterase [Pirellulaceae bacterium]